MSLQDIFYLTLSVSAVVITVTIIFLAYTAVQAIKTAKKVMEGVKETGESLSIIKEGLQLGALKFATDLLSKFRGGDKNG